MVAVTLGVLQPLHHTAADRCSQPYGSLPVFSGFLGGAFSPLLSTQGHCSVHTWDVPPGRPRCLCHSMRLSLLILGLVVPLHA